MTTPHYGTHITVASKRAAGHSKVGHNTVCAQQSEHTLMARAVVRGNAACDDAADGIAVAIENAIESMGVHTVGIVAAHGSIVVRRRTIVGNIVG